MKIGPAEPARAATRAAVELAALVRESVTADAAREVLHLSLSELGPALRRPHHRRMLRDALQESLAAARASIFDLPNGDVVAVARLPAPGLAEAQAALLASLDAGSAAAVRRLRLPEEAATLLNATAASLGLEPVEHDPPTAPPVLPSSGLPLASTDLAGAERALASADLDPVTTRGWVCRMDPEGGEAAPQWEDRRLNWPALLAVALPERDVVAAPGLARRLGRLAEARMLAELARPVAQLEWRPVGLPLAPATIEGPAFARFAAALPAGRSREVTVALRTADLLADPAAASRVVPALRAGGFRVAFDDLLPETLDLLPPQRLQPDVVRLVWSPALAAGLPRAAAALLDAAPEHVVLTAVDRAAAIAWGWEAGIRLFQGPLVEKRRRHAA